MHRSRAAIVLLLAAATAGCTPTFNWREVRADPSGLKAMLPCKPDKGSRRVPMAGREVEMSVIGCDTGGATYAILQAELADAAGADQVLSQWTRATLANMKSERSQAQPFVPPGADRLPSSQRISAQGRRPDGSPVRGEAAYFARGRHVVQAVVYAEDPKAGTLQPFFEGLKFP
jgi:hypothetical protein